jgi:hypothetical protein
LIAAAEVERLISGERFRTYLRATHDAKDAMALYLWNARVSGAFAELLHHDEVFVRLARPRPGKVISELNFGFWRFLTSDRYEQSLWGPALDHGFTAPGATVRARRRAVEDRLAPLHLLRNRIAHCEPIFGTVSHRRRRANRSRNRSITSTRTPSSWSHGCLLLPAAGSDTTSTMWQGC